MLEEVERLFNAFERWGTQHPIMGWIVMGYLGGYVATARMYEKAGVKFTALSFLGRGFIKGVIGVFVAVCVYGGWTALALSQKWGILVGGLCGVFGTDILEAVLVLGLDFLRKRFGLTASLPAPKVAPDAPPRGTPADGS